MSLGLLDLALELAGQSDSEAKWRQLGELALSSGQLAVARRCFVRAKDLGGLLLLHSSHADAAGLGELASMAGECGHGGRSGWLRYRTTLFLTDMLPISCPRHSTHSPRLLPCSCPGPAPQCPPHFCCRPCTPFMASTARFNVPPPLRTEAAGKQNIAFVCHFLLGRLDACVDLLVGCGRLPEAAFFARTYAPSRVAEVVKLWQADLAKINPKAAESLANPEVGRWGLLGQCTGSCGRSLGSWLYGLVWLRPWLCWSTWA